MNFDILQATDDLEKKQKSAFKTFPLMQKDSIQKQTNVALPDDDNVAKVREFCQENKK